MKGEVQCKDRAYNSLLENYVDFDTATKLPPQITQQTTNLIEAMIKQRIQDELFDDPIRKVGQEVQNHMDDVALDFTKASKGLGDQYAEEFANKLMAQNPDVFLDQDIHGADSALKKEIDEIFTGLMRNLNQLSNIHFTPKAMKKESKIRTQNVAALSLEEAIPINVSNSNLQPLLKIDPKQMRDKEELTKEEKRQERAAKKRHIRGHLHKKEIKQKEERRKKGLAQVGDRFLMQSLNKKKVDSKKENNEKTQSYRSGAFFKELTKVTAEDKKKKDNKRVQKQTGKAGDVLHNHGSAKRFKI